MGDKKQFCDIITLVMYPTDRDISYGAKSKRKYTKHIEKNLTVVLLLDEQNVD